MRKRRQKAGLGFWGLGIRLHKEPSPERVAPGICGNGVGMCGSGSSPPFLGRRHVGFSGFRGRDLGIGPRTRMRVSDLQPDIDMHFQAHPATAGDLMAMDPHF